MNLSLEKIIRTSSPEVHYRMTYSAQFLKNSQKFDDVVVVIDIGPLGRQYHVKGASQTLNDEDSEFIIGTMKQLYSKNQLP